MPPSTKTKNDDTRGSKRAVESTGESPAKCGRLSHQEEDEGSSSSTTSTVKSVRNNSGILDQVTIDKSGEDAVGKDGSRANHDADNAKEVGTATTLLNKEGKGKGKPQEDNDGRGNDNQLERNAETAKGTGSGKEPVTSTGVSVTNTEALWTFNNPGWIPAKVLERVRVAASVSDTLRHRFALATVNPKATTFGGYKETFLCYQGKVLTVTFVARVMSTFFSYGEGSQPARCASVKFKFLRDIDEIVARALVYEKANPTFVTSKKTFWAGKKCTIWKAKEKRKDVYWFDQLYDGTERVTSKSKMKRPVELSLYENDLAIFECQVRRYRPKTATDWSKWTTTFKLCSIVRLWAATPNIEDEEESEDETMQRVETDSEFEGF